MSTTQHHKSSPTAQRHRMDSRTGSVDRMEGGAVSDTSMMKGRACRGENRISGVLLTVLRGNEEE